MAQIDGQEEYRNLAAAVFAMARRDYHELKGKLARMNERSWVEKWLRVHGPREQRQAKGNWRRERGYQYRGYTRQGEPDFKPLTNAQLKAMAHHAYRMKVKQYEDEIAQINDLYAGSSLWSDILEVADIKQFAPADRLNAMHETAS
jgi:hypothetical protein